MKNILLSAKSCNRIQISLYSVSITVCVLSAIAVFFAGCKKDPEKDPETFVSDVARPTWTVPESYDYSSSMTAVVKVDLEAQYPEKAADFVLDDNDLLAAFAGETCLGVASPQDGLFYLYIAGANDEMVTLRYYSTHYKNLFEAKDAFPFTNDAHLGTVAEPLAPKFVETK